MIITLNIDEKQNRRFIKDIKKCTNKEDYILKLYKFKTQLLGARTEDDGPISNEIVDFDCIETRQELVEVLCNLCNEAFKVIENTFINEYHTHFYPVVEYPIDDILIRILTLASYLKRYEKDEGVQNERN